MFKCLNMLRSIKQSSHIHFFFFLSGFFGFLGSFDFFSDWGFFDFFNFSSSRTQVAHFGNGESTIKQRITLTRWKERRGF